MSRSWKHTGGYKDHNKFFKNYANRKVRRMPIELTGVAIKKYTEGYNISDWKCIDYNNDQSWDEPAYKRFMK